MCACVLTRGHDSLGRRNKAFAPRAEAVHLVPAPQLSLWGDVEGLYAYRGVGFRTALKSGKSFHPRAAGDLISLPERSLMSALNCMLLFSRPEKDIFLFGLGVSERAASQLTVPPR